MDAPVWKCAVIAAGMWQVYILEHIWCVYVYLPASISIFWSSHEPLEVTMQQERKYDKMTALWYEKRRKTLLQSCIQPRTVSLQPKCNQHWCYYKGHKTHKNYFSMLGVHLCYMIWVCVHYISCTLYNLTHLKQFSLPCELSDRILETSLRLMVRIGVFSWKSVITLLRPEIVIDTFTINTHV